MPDTTAPRVHLSLDERESLCIGGECDYHPYTRHSAECNRRLVAIRTLLAEHTIHRVAGAPAHPDTITALSAHYDSLKADRERISDAEPAGPLAWKRQSELIADYSRRIAVAYVALTLVRGDASEPA